MRAFGGERAADPQRQAADGQQRPTLTPAFLQPDPGHTPQAIYISPPVRAGIVVQRGTAGHTAIVEDGFKISRLVISPPQPPAPPSLLQLTTQHTSLPALTQAMPSTPTHTPQSNTEIAAAAGCSPVEERTSEEGENAQRTCSRKRNVGA
ncbi:hypothetical protein MHYP_G00064630 [Metynnis hypsauchen]